MSTELGKREDLLPVANLNEPLPNLDDAQELPVDLCGSYWTPEDAGESKRLFFVEVKPQKVISATNPDELIYLDCAVFIENKDGEVQTVINGSRRLVGAIEQCIDSGRISKGSPISVTYMGKRKNKTNGFSSDNWSIKPLIIKL